ncbi:RluA family pseudouridine synthase [Bacillus sp. B15-48]|uniref:RluA family pseudouridine synthase n=1 Tax=Bacillus sp. B15-48 TaxID=1548601 RepID=UPI00193EF083|nr:RluA family pseudouridine synthase [Bacillus sp. B15-48]MBM4764259.1 RluA family pseudouridine synthase [Bacillus sp. B15-48]
MDKRFKLNWTVKKSDHGKQLREFLREQDLSKSAITDVKFKGGALFVNGKEVTVRYHLKEADWIEIYFPTEEPPAAMIVEDFFLHILYEDEFLLVVNKPAGMNTIPSREHPTGSLANGLLGYYKQSGIYATTHIVTRLDRDTSGIVLIAKHRHIHHLLSMQQKENQISRIYEALVEGIFDLECGKIEEPIARKSNSIIERVVNPNGQYACTYYRVISEFEKFSYLELRLITGRTHQIRVHLSYLNHPLLGDDLYGGKTELIKRQALHCRELEFIHPVLQEKMNFFAPLPSDIENILKNSKPI